MPVPKRRASKAVGRRRRSSKKLVRPGLSICPNCKEMTVPHEVCRACGHYRGEKILEGTAE